MQWLYEAIPSRDGAVHCAHPVTWWYQCMVEVMVEVMVKVMVEVMGDIMGEVTTHCAHPGHSVAPRSPSRVSSQIRFNSSYILFNSSYIRFNSSYIRFNSSYIKKGAGTIAITSRDGIIHHVTRWRDSFATIFFPPQHYIFCAA